MIENKSKSSSHKGVYFLLIGFAFPLTALALVAIDDLPKFARFVGAGMALVSIPVSLTSFVMSYKFLTGPIAKTAALLLFVTLFVAVAGFILIFNRAL